MTNRTLQILVVGSDPDLRRELEAALPAAWGARVVLHTARDVRSGLEAVRARHPQIVAMELGADLGALRAFASELGNVAPASVLVGVYAREGHGPAQTESTLLIEAMRAQVRDFLRRPISSTELREVLERAMSAKRDPAQASPIGKVISFHSTKGGVGKSTLSISTACALGLRHPDRVLLIDASLQLGVCSAALDVAGATSLVEAVRERDRLDPTMLRDLASPHAAGVRLLAAPRDAVEASEVTEEAFTRIVTLARHAFEFVIIDTFPMLDGLILSALDLSDLVFLVNQGTVPDVIGAAELVKVLDQIGIGRARRRLVLNRNHAGFSGQLTPGDVALRLGQELDFVVPYEKRLLTALNLGEPWILKAPRGRGWASVVHAIASEIEAQGGGTESSEPTGERGIAGAFSLMRRWLGGRVPS